MKKQKRMSSMLVWIIVFAVGAGVLGFSLMLVHRNRKALRMSVVKDLTQLKDILERIHASCQITSFDSLKTPINFLNVKAFTGSEVGGMNLAYPKKWEGPYLKDNPKIEGIEYQIIHTRDGDFIAPGDGVRLSNKKVIGKDIVLGSDTDVQMMMKDKRLLDNGQEWIVKLSFTTGLVGAAQEYLVDDSF